MQESTWPGTIFHVCCPLQPYPLKTGQVGQGACKDIRAVLTSSVAQKTIKFHADPIQSKPSNLCARTHGGRGRASLATRKPQQRIELPMCGQLFHSRLRTAGYYRSLGAPMPLPRPNCRDLSALPGDCLAMPFCRSSCCCWPHSSSSSPSTNACGSTCGKGHMLLSMLLCRTHLSQTSASCVWNAVSCPAGKRQGRPHFSWRWLRLRRISQYFLGSEWTRPCRQLTPRSLTR